MGDAKKNGLYVVSIVLVVVLLRLPTFLYSYVNIDETDYTLAAQIILDGGLPYRDFLIYQPPLIYYIYALGFLLTGGIHLSGAHIITILFVAGTSLSIYSIVKSMANAQSGLVAGLAYAAYSALFIPQDMLATNCEVLMMFPMALAALFLLKAGEKKSLALTFFAGIMIGLGALAKYQGGIVWAAAIGYFIYNFLAPCMSHASKGRNSAFHCVTSSLVLTLGFLAPPALFALYLYLNGVLSYAVEAFRYILLYAKGPAQSDILYVILKFFTRSLIFSLTSLPIWLASLYVIYGQFRGGINRAPNAGVSNAAGFVKFVVIWFFLSIIPIIMGGRIYFHYYFIILPSACILFGIWWSTRNRERKWLTRAIAGWAIICTIGWETYAIVTPLTPPKAKETWVVAADYLKDIARPGETMFVWGCCYQLYFVSGLKPGTRFTSADYLTGRSPMTAGLEYNPNTPAPPSSLEKLYRDFTDRPGVVIFDTSNNIFPKAWEYFKEDIKKNLPTYIVDTTESNYRRYGRYPIANYPYLKDLLETNYEKLKEIDGYIIYKKSVPGTKGQS